MQRMLPISNCVSCLLRCGCLLLVKVVLVVLVMVVWLVLLLLLMLASSIRILDRFFHKRSILRPSPRTRLARD